jgi:hypothetical protein
VGLTVGNAPGTAMTWSATWTRGTKRKGACDTCVSLGGGERGREREVSTARQLSPFEMEAGEAGEGVSGWAPRGEHEKRGPVLTCGGQRGRRGVSAQWGGAESLKSGARLAAGVRRRRGACGA